MVFQFLCVSSFWCLWGIILKYRVRFCLIHSSYKNDKHMTVFPEFLLQSHTYNCKLQSYRIGLKLTLWKIPKKQKATPIDSRLYYSALSMGVKYWHITIYLSNLLSTSYWIGKLCVLYVYLLVMKNMYGSKERIPVHQDYTESYRLHIESIYLCY